MARFSPSSRNSPVEIDEVVDVADIAPTRGGAVAPPASPVYVPVKSGSFWRVKGLFLLTVVIPTALAAGYYGLIASDVYVSESRFVVRSPQRPLPSNGITALLQGVGFGRANDDSFTIQEFMLSRDSLRTLDDLLGLRQHYSDRSIDRLSRFPSFDFDDSFEGLHRYYQKFVSIQHDSATSISTLRVRAFSANQSLKMNQQLLSSSEDLVNRMNDRARSDLIKYAKSELEAAEAKSKAAIASLTGYRNKQSVVDPDKQAAVQMQSIARLQDELSAANVQLSQLRTLTPDNPQIPSLSSKVDTLSRQIAAESGKMSGGGGSLANKSGDFLRLSLDVEFAGKQLASALASYELARNDAQRQQVYLERVADPSLPDMAQEPKRLRNVLFTLLMGFIAWGVLSMLLAGVREHQD